MEPPGTAHAESWLRLTHDEELLNLAERLGREVKRRLEDLDPYLPCRRQRPLTHARTWLGAWRGYYNWIRP
jgi:hypothetical protein